MADEVRPFERKVFDARRRGEIDSDATPDQIEEAERKGIITTEEAASIRRFDAIVMDLTGVDDFDPGDLSRRPRPGRTKKKRAKRAASKMAPPDDTDTAAADD